MQLLLLGAWCFHDGQRTILGELVAEKGFEIVRQRDTTSGGGVLDAFANLGGNPGL
ncbi:hypothetical protein IWX81_002856 [Salinibacterium sp. CAN_S4]